MISLIFVLLAAVSNSVMDVLQFHFTRSIFIRGEHLFWNPEISWENKWKNGDPSQGEKFWGSTRWFVFATDGWHLAQFLMLTFFSLAIVFYQPMHSWWLDLIIYKVLFGVGFELFYTKVFR